MEKYEKIPNLSFLKDALMDNENGYRKIKINRAFIKKCLRINGRAMDILYVYDPSMLLDPELLHLRTFKTPIL